MGKLEHKLSFKDIEFLQFFESCRFDATKFHHREHVRLAYILLTLSDFDQALSRLKKGLLAFLSYNDVDDSKYHETMTYAWLLAVKHFMHISKPASDSEDFLKENDVLLNKDIMFTHYSRDVMNSDVARKSVVKPDLDLIPIHE